jgi:hypothetical protein
MIPESDNSVGSHCERARAGSDRGFPNLLVGGSKSALAQYLPRDETVR